MVISQEQRGIPSHEDGEPENAVGARPQDGPEQVARRPHGAFRVPATAIAPFPAVFPVAGFRSGGLRRRGARPLHEQAPPRRLRPVTEAVLVDTGPLVTLSLIHI